MGRFVTRERLHVDRIATAWALRRFVDPGATFTFVPWTKDARAVAGTPFDMRGAELSHRGERCTFEVVAETYGIVDPAVARMGRIVRGADLPHEDDVSVEAAGVRAVFDGIRDGDFSDDERLVVGSAICDALYAYCRAATSGR
jgi:hypothetical protein